MCSKIKNQPIATNPKGFEIGGTSVVWSDISAITAYKLDLITFDEIRLRIDLYVAPFTLDISEESPGYQDLISAFESNFPIPRDRWSTIAIHAFKTNETLLYRRGQPLVHPGPNRA
jgi:hypothetical protein